MRLEHQQLLSGLIRLHILHHAVKAPLYGNWMIEELRRHGYHISAGTLYPLLHGMQRQGYLSEKTARSNGLTLRVGSVLVELDKEHTLSTIGYNGQVPGPVIRLREGKVVTVDLFNDTDTPELVHWHGQIIPSEVDGAMEEKSLVVPARGHLSYQ